MADDSQIFISYRRRDASGHAGHLYEYLSGRLGDDRIFFDRSSIESGDVFPTKLREGVEECAVLLALIGPEWLDCTDNDGGRRLDNPDDFVRQEIALALERGKKIIPVLFDDTPAPPPDRLPVPLKALASCDPLTLRGKTDEYELQRRKLIRLLAKELDGIDEEHVEYDGSDIGSEATALKSPKLKEFQKSIYDTFDLLGITSLSHYHALAEQERSVLNREILSKLIGLRSPPDDLLEREHFNTLFKQIPRQSSAHQDHWNILHRNTAVYSDHSLVCVAPLRLRSQDNTMPEQIIDLLLQHRPLVETGKMSIVPNVVTIVAESQGSRDTTIFNARTLDTVKVDLLDRVIKEFFLTEGTLLKRQGAIKFQSPNSAGLSLEHIIEIIDRYYNDEFRHFQRHLKRTMRSLNPEDNTYALRDALRAVDDGIRALDAKYESVRRTRLSAVGAGALAVVLYGTGSESMSFIASAFAASSLSASVSFIPGSDLPRDITQSPFFVPWLISSRKPIDATRAII